MTSNQNINTRISDLFTLTVSIFLLIVGTIGSVFTPLYILDGRLGQITDGAVLVLYLVYFSMIMMGLVMLGVRWKKREERRLDQ